MKAKAWITIPHITKDDNGFVCEEEILPLVLCCDCEHFDGDNCCMKNGLVIPDNETGSALMGKGEAEMSREFIITCVNEKDADQIEREYPNSELVRCKDCKYYHQSLCGFCDLLRKAHAAYWFCADGERRSTNETNCGAKMDGERRESE